MSKINFKKLKKDLLASDPTLYCSIIAQLRGKLHMSKVHGSTVYETTGKSCWTWFGYQNTKCIADERRHMFHWTMADQDLYTQPWMKRISEEYMIEEEEAAA